MLFIPIWAGPQDGGSAYVRLNFNFGGNYAPALKFPKQVFLKELSLRSSHAKHAAKVSLLSIVLSSPLFFILCYLCVGKPAQYCEC